MEWQIIVNLAGGFVLTAIGWWCRQIWESVDKLKEDIRKIEVDLPSYYVKKDEIAIRFDRIEHLLDKLYEKMEQKVDK